MKKQPRILMCLNVDGIPTEVEFSIESLRNWLNSIKVNSKDETVPFYFTINGKEYMQKINIKTELANIKQSVKLAELFENIIPFNLRNYIRDLTQELAQKKTVKVIGREHEIEKAWFYLSQKNRNNVFLVGEHDVGKTAIALEIARRIAIGNCPKELSQKRVIELTPSALLEMKNSVLYEHKIGQLFLFLKKNRNNIIFYVDKAISMLADTELFSILLTCIKKYHIPTMVTCCNENFEEYITDEYDEISVSKYINYVWVDEPALDEVEPMVRQYIRNLSKKYGICISPKMVKYAIYTSSLNYGDLANPGNSINIFERAFQIAKRKGKNEVDKECILGCYNTQVKYYLKTPIEEKRATAYHEVGHYLVFTKNKNANDVEISCVSILPMHYWAGVTMSYTNIEKYTTSSKDYYVDMIASYMAGRIAEEKITNQISSGVSADLQYATATAKAVVMQFGLVPGVINRTYDTSDYHLMPESTKKLIDDAVQDLINEGYKRAVHIINENEQLLEYIAETLLVEEVLSKEELDAICKKFEEKNCNK